MAISASKSANKARARKCATRRNRCRLFAVVFSLGCIAALYVYSRVAESVYVDAERSLEMEEERCREAEILERVRQDPFSVTVPDSIVVRIAIPNSQDFLDRKTLKVSRIKPLALPGVALQPSWPAARWAGELMPFFERKDTERVTEYVLFCLCQCRDLVSWCIKSTSTDNVFVPSRPILPHIYKTGYPSVFGDEEKIAVNGGLRHRLPVTYTDLARMLCILENSPAGELKPYVGVEDERHCQSQLLTGSMYVAYSIACEWVKEAKAPRNGKAPEDYEVALALHDTLCRNTEYTNEMHAADNETLVVDTLLRGHATSLGYARTYMLLLSMAGIENVYVTGEFSMNGKTGAHVEQAWNLVRLEGKWVHIDVAADDQFPVSGKAGSVARKMAETPSHSYFALSDAQMARTHQGGCLFATGNTTQEEYVAVTDSLNYFSRIGYLDHGERRSAVFSDAAELMHAIMEQAAAGVAVTEYRVTAPNVVDALATLLETNGTPWEIHLTPPDANGVIQVCVESS